MIDKWDIVPIAYQYVVKKSNTMCARQRIKVGLLADFQTFRATNQYFRTRNLYRRVKNRFLSWLSLAGERVIVFSWAGYRFFHELVIAGSWPGYRRFMAFIAFSWAGAPAYARRPPAYAREHRSTRGAPAYARSTGLRAEHRRTRGVPDYARTTICTTLCET